MPRFQPPNALLFLITLFRPQLLRPDIRVPNIGHVDYKAFRRIGFNAVVIDKDNCLTLPEHDRLFPPLQTAWTELLSAFDPGKVLIVSNSAGTKKDPGALAAESVTKHLRTPVLLHPTPKPACSSLILQYFNGELAPPHDTLAATIRKRNQQLAQEEWDDKDAFVKMFTPLAKGKILGEPTRVKGSGVGGRDLTDPFTVPEEAKREKEEERGVDSAKDSVKIEAGQVESITSDTIDNSSVTPVPIPANMSKESLRILVIGDRLFTDTLLAYRLRATLGPENVVSIQTTLLPDPSDVRILRWIENKMSRGRLRVGREDWGRFVVRDNSEEELTAIKEQGLGWKRFIPFGRQLVGAPEMTWRWNTWSFWGVVRGSGRALRRIGGAIGRGSRWAWLRGRNWVQERRALRRAQAIAAAEGTEVSQGTVAGETVPAVVVQDTGAASRVKAI